MWVNLFFIVSPLIKISNFDQADGHWGVLQPLKGVLQPLMGVLQPLKGGIAAIKGGIAAIKGGIAANKGGIVAKSDAEFGGEISVIFSDSPVRFSILGIFNHLPEF